MKCLYMRNSFLFIWLTRFKFTAFLEAGKAYGVDDAGNRKIFYQITMFEWRRRS